MFYVTFTNCYKLLQITDCSDFVDFISSADKWTDCEIYWGCVWIYCVVQTQKEEYFTELFETVQILMVLAVHILLYSQLW